MVTINDYIEQVRQLTAARETKREDAGIAAGKEYDNIAAEVKTLTSNDLKEVMATLAQIEAKIDMLTQITAKTKESYIEEKLKSYDIETQKLHDELLLKIMKEINSDPGAVTNSETETGNVVISAGGRK